MKSTVLTVTNKYASLARTNNESGIFTIIDDNLGRIVEDVNLALHNVVHVHIRSNC
jgi:hypothetical protein